MDDALRKLIDGLVEGDHEARRQLLEVSMTAPAKKIAALADNDLTVVRGLAAEVAVRRGLDEVTTRLAQDSEPFVRLCVALALGDPAATAPEAVWGMLFADASDEVRVTVAKAAGVGAERFDSLIDLLAYDDEWEVRVAAVHALRHFGPRDTLLQVLHTLGEDGIYDVRQACAEVAETGLRVLGGYPDEIGRPSVATLAGASEHLRELGVERFPRLAAWLEERAEQDIDYDALAAFGTVLTVEAQAGRLKRAFGVDQVCEDVEAVLARPGTRSAVLLGESGTGKTAVAHELVHRLMGRGWTVLRVGATDIMAGTRYTGEWETRVNDLVAAVQRPKRVVIYVPSLEELSMAGRWSRSDMNAAAAMAPHIENGSIAVLGESTREAFRRGLGQDTSLRRLFAPIDMKPAPAEQTRRIVGAVCESENVECDTEFLDRLDELADFYDVSTAQPGRSVGLLRRVLETRKETGPLRPRDILKTLSSATGIPVDFLDDDRPLDLDGVRAFFEARVMGQPEAVDAVVDLVALIKAGLTDPHKPYGVHFFVGPTGVGKTEMARALAELIFGDPSRLQRFDMSEYATYYAYERLNGAQGRPGQLTMMAREHPFSVLLLDEIEKAHDNVFDLCLQIFDAGRLTDGQGKTADFRRMVIIMTSNVGSAVASEPQLGFGADETEKAVDKDHVLREVKRFFRPEFLNRLDRIVTFRALAVETAEKIARRELAKVIERSGITRRHLAVDIEPQVLGLLLKDGYSPAFGARPLKRTVERLVLMPVARAIAAGRVADGSVLQLRVRGPNIVVKIVDSTDEGDSTTLPPADLGDVRNQVEALKADSSRVEARKTMLLEQTHDHAFWSNRPVALAVMDEIHRLDALLKSFSRLEEDLDRTVANPDPKKAARFLDRHEREARRLAFLFAADDLGDALVTLTLVKAQGKGLDGVRTLARMYRSLAGWRDLECEVLDDRRGGEPPEDTITLAVGGPGAYALLMREAGLHQMSRPEAGSRKAERSLVRVEVLPSPRDETAYPDSEFKL